MQRASLLRLGSALALLAACAPLPTATDRRTPAVGVPSQAILVRDSYAGGARLRDSAVVDSTVSRWRRFRCGPVNASAAPCDPQRGLVDSGAVMPNHLANLFQRTGRADFQALAPHYARTGLTAPDLEVHRLEVVQNGTRLTVTWESGASLPPALAAARCHLDVSFGALIYCAN